MIGRRGSLGGAVLAAFVVVGLRGWQGVPVELILVSPTAETVVSGRLMLEAEIRPATAVVRGVEFYVDGQKACAAPAAPYRCSWDAGTTSAQRDIRVVAQLGDGGQVVQRIRTAPPPPSFHAIGTSVLVSVHVRDGNGRFVRGLEPSDFRVLEDGVPQEIQSVSTDDSVPADVLLALDVSGSMAPAVGELKAVARGFLSALRPTDFVTVAAFNNVLSVLSPRAADTQKHLAALEQLRPTGGTALYDAMIQGAGLMSNTRGAAARRAMVVLTDGDDVSSVSSASAARVILQRHDVVLYVVAQGKAAESQQLKGQLGTLASETGGAAFFAPRMSALRDHFKEIVADLSNQYVLGYSPKKAVGDGAWRRITVQAIDKKKHYEIRAREGYLAVQR